MDVRDRENTQLDYNPCYAINAEMRARQGKRVFSTGVYKDVHERENTQLDYNPCHALNAEMRAVQGVGVSATGVYIDAHELADTHHYAEMRRIYVFKTYIRV